MVVTIESYCPMYSITTSYVSELYRWDSFVLPLTSLENVGLLTYYVKALHCYKLIWFKTRGGNKTEIYYETLILIIEIQVNNKTHHRKNSAV